MTKLSTTLRLLIVVCFTLALASMAQAQATRTWVSGVGDDANPCSRTAPCKTFAGAISKTATGGEIDALDPGGFGQVTITKSITIDGCCITSILGTAGNAVNINIPSGGSDTRRRVVLRHITFNGADLGSRAVNVTAALSVSIENCFIQNFIQEGINTSAVTDSNMLLSVKDTNITNGAVGINLAATGGTAVIGMFDNVRVEKMSGNGLSIGPHGKADVRNCVFKLNGGDGIGMTGGITDGSANVENCFIGSNSVGIRNGGTGSVVDLSNTSVVSNSTGLASTSGAAGGGINSHGNNQISGNGASGTVPNPIGQQ